MPPPLFTRPRLRFGAFECDFEARELRKSGLRLKLQEQPFRILEALLENPGRVITREELRKRLWPDGVFVDFDRSLNKSIVRLREVLGDSADAPRYIETLPRHGYRFLAEVSAVEANGNGVARDAIAAATGTDGPAETATASPAMSLPKAYFRRKIFWVLVALAALVVALAVILPPALERRGQASGGAESGIVVLPIRNFSGDPAQEYFSDGISEALVTSLGKLGSLRVISLTTAMQYKNRARSVPEIARELKVDSVLEGSVSRSGQKVRISLNLIDGRSDRHLWSDTFDGEVSEMLSLQSRIALAVAEQVPSRIKATAQPERSSRKVSPAAYEDYLRGRYLWNRRNKESLLKSIEYFNKANAEQSDYAEAYAGIADAYASLSSFYLPPHECMPKARAAALHAIELRNDLPEAYATLGVVAFMYDWDWAQAERYLVRAVSLNPSYAPAHNALGALLISQGRGEEGVREVMRAAELDPLSLEVSLDVESWLFASRRWDLLRAHAEQTLAIAPGFSFGHASMGEALGRTGHAAEAAQEAVLAEKTADNPIELSLAGDVYAIAGKRNDVERILRRLEGIASRQYVCSYELAALHVALDHRDAAFALLQRGVSDRTDCMPFLNVDPRFDALHQDPRFPQVLKAVGLTPP